MTTDFNRTHQPLPQSPPTVVAWLGYGGLLPFVLLALASLVDAGGRLIWGQALLAYGAVILSFVGALHWGFAMTASGFTPHQRTTCFVWSVVPALLAWVALVVVLLMTSRFSSGVGPEAASALLVLGFVAHYGQDKRLARATTLPVWYLPLRLRLTSVACVSLTLGALA